jgi:hypothetical protein
MLCELGFDHLDDDFIGQQRAADHIPLGSLAELGAFVAVLAQDVAGRDLPCAETLLQNLRLRAFAGSRWPQEDETHQRLINPR